MFPTYTAGHVSSPDQILASSPILPLVMMMREEQEEEETVAGREGEAQDHSVPTCPAAYQGLQGKITLALNLILDDTPRALLLLSSLQQFFNFHHVHQFLIIVPDHHYLPIHLIFQNMTMLKAVVIQESQLLVGNDEEEEEGLKAADGYAKQMALKLLVAQIIQTEYYLTLDADVLALKAGMGFEDLVMDQKAIYVNER